MSGVVGCSDYEYEYEFEEIFLSFLSLLYIFARLCEKAWIKPLSFLYIYLLSFLSNAIGLSIFP